MSGTYTRAKRFPIETSVRYRERGEDAWSTGRTLNVSRTGVLFESDRATHIGATIEIVLELAAPLATVVCSGQVVRTVPHEAAFWGTAATISRYLLVPKPKSEEE